MGPRIGATPLLHIAGALIWLVKAGITAWDGTCVPKSISSLGLALGWSRLRCRPLRGVARGELVQSWPMFFSIPGNLLQLAAVGRRERAPPCTSVSSSGDGRCHGGRVFFLWANGRSTGEVGVDKQQLSDGHAGALRDGTLWSRSGVPSLP